MQPSMIMNAPVRPRGTPASEQFCDECGHPFYPAREHQRFCSTTCRQALHRRRAERGAELYDLAMAWRAKRQRGGFTAFCQAVDRFLDDERSARRVRDAVRQSFRQAQRDGR